MESTLTIRSRDGRSYLSISRSSEDAYCVEMDIDVGHGKFYAKNSDLILDNIGGFATQLDYFLTSREIRPCLKGVYNSSIELSGNATEVMLHATIGDAFCGYNKTVFYSTTGSFSIDQEYLNQILEFFHRQMQP